MDILQFKGEYRWLSNFWPVEIVFEGVFYPSVEHAYQAAKVDPLQREPFRTGTAGQAKKLGNSISLCSNWELIKVSIMRQLLAEKFRIDSPLAKLLISTVPGQLVEGNNWNDKFWGVCNGSGKNMLGELLMERRYYLINQSNIGDNVLIIHRSPMNGEECSG